MKARLWTRSYTIAVVVIFGIYMVSGILLSVMAIHAKNITGLDTYAGSMISTFTLGALAVRFLAGRLIERFSSKKVILTGLVILIMGSIWLLLSAEITQILIARVLQGVGFGLSATAASTFVAIICHPTRLLEGISYMAVGQSLTAVLGPSIGFWIIGAEYDRFHTLFLAAIIVAIITLFIMFFETNEHNGSIHLNIQDTSDKIRWSLLCLPILILFMNSLSQSAITSFLALFAISLNFAGAGSFFSINAIGMISSRFVMNRLVKRFGEFPMILINTIIFSCCVFLLTQVTSLYQMLIIAFPAGFAMGSVAPIINTYLIQNVPGNKKGTANALYFSALDIGYGIGSVIWGFVAMTMGYVQVFYLSAVLQVAAILLTVFHMRMSARSNSGIVLETNKQ